MRKILAIDDHKENLLSIKGLLKYILPEAILFTAESGKKGIEIAKSELPDVILLDIVMPDIDGYETCRLIKQDILTKHIPVIMLSSLGQEPINRIKGFNIGADSFLARPFNPTELKALINVMLRIKNAEDALRFDKKNLESIVNERTKKFIESNEKLKKSEERFRQILETSQEWVWEVNMNGVFTFSSSMVHKMMGYNAKEIVGEKHFYDFFNAEERGGLTHDVFEIIKRKETFLNFTSCNNSKNGNIVWLSSSGMPLFNEDNKLIGYRGSSRDISESKFDLQIQAIQIRLVEFANDHSVSELLQLFLDEAEQITKSSLGFYHFIDDDQESIILQQRSTNTIKNCDNKQEMKNYSISEFGVLEDCFKERKAVIYNDFKNLSHKKEVQEALPNILRQLLVPVIRGEKIIAIVTLGNKKSNYDQQDIKIVQRLADATWEIIVRKRTEETLRKSEELNRSITKTAVDAIISIDNSGIVLSWNTAAERIFGYPSSTMIGKDLSIIIPSRYVEGHKKGIKRIISGEKDKLLGKIIELNALKSDGSEFPIELSLSGWEADNKKYFTGIIRDITKRKKSDQIQSVLYHISDAVTTSKNLEELFVTIRDQLKSIIDTNNYYIAMYDEETDMVSLPFMIDEKDQISSFPAGKTMTAYVIKSQQSLLANATQQKKMAKEGLIEFSGSRSKIWLGVPLKIDDKVTGVLAVQSYSDEKAYDESDMKMLEFVSDQISLSIHRKKAVGELIDALERATESDKLKTAFLQNISHEIRTPMNGILGFASLLSNPDISGEEQKSYIDIISISGNRMLNTLNDLMDISMLETGQVKLVFSKTNINNDLTSLYNNFKEEAENKGLQLNCILPLPNLEVIIETDKEKLYAILSNLIKNSIKYTNKGRIDFGYVKKEDCFEFFVNDTGIGIPKNRLEAIFSRFVQADIEDVKVFEGSGLGLSISKAYVEMLKGKIWVDSFKGKGSNFYFTIPFANDVSHIVNDEISLAKINKQEISKPKILIVEDELFASEYLGIILENVSSEILFAENGKNAIEVCKENPDIRIILMDMKMPIMGGYEATKEIRKFNKEVVIIAQSAYALGGDREKAIEVGCNKYITKPVNKDELMEKLDEYL